jgi:hypothetical protein
LLAIAAATSFLKTAAEGLGPPKNCETKALKKELAMSMVAAISASTPLSMRPSACSAAMYLCSRAIAPWGPFVASGERFAIGGEELGVGEEAAEHGDDALVKGEGGAEGLCQILMGRESTDGLLESFEGDEHIGEALFEDREEQGEAVVEVDVEGRF